MAFGGGGSERRKFILFFGIAVNLALIGYYKYLNFFMQNLALAFGFSWQAQEIFLPLGISFFTFQQIAWLVDSYRGEASSSPDVRSFLDYALFVSFFPQLIAGPIVHHGEIIPQFKNKRTFVLDWRNIAVGLSLFSLGLFKKVVIADTLSPWVADGFDNSDALTFIEAWAAALSYTFQIYFDFSGYSDMAMGLGKFFNVNIPMNFNSPYKATSIIDFWRRWHITLSVFLRDYVYIPLGGNRLGSLRRYVNLLATMLIGGLWHGAAWQFVFWGFLHGVYLCVNNLWRRASEQLKIGFPKAIGWGLTFVSVVVAWVFFRAASFGRAVDILWGMCGGHGVVVPENYLPIRALRSAFEKFGAVIVERGALMHFKGFVETATLAVLLVFVIVMRNSREWTERRFAKSGSFYVWSVVNFALVCALLFMTRMSEFLYFQF